MNRPSAFIRNLLIHNIGPGLVFEDWLFDITIIGNYIYPDA